MQLVIRHGELHEKVNTLKAKNVNEPVTEGNRILNEKNIKGAETKCRKNLRRKYKRSTKVGRKKKA